MLGTSTSFRISGRAAAGIACECKKPLCCGAEVTAKLGYRLCQATGHCKVMELHERAGQLLVRVPEALDLLLQGL